MKTFFPPRSRKKWVEFEKKSFGFGKKNSAPIPILSADTVTDTKFWSDTINFCPSEPGMNQMLQS